MADPNAYKVTEQKAKDLAAAAGKVTRAVTEIKTRDEACEKGNATMDAVLNDQAFKDAVTFIDGL